MTCSESSSSRLRSLGEERERRIGSVAVVELELPGPERFMRRLPAVYLIRQRLS